MPELDFVFHPDEEINFVELALENRLEFVPNVDYREAPEYAILRTLGEYQEWRPRTRSFYLLSETFESGPLLMSEIERDGRTLHYIRQRSGGPYIDFLASVASTGEDRFISQGFLAYYSTYWDEKLQCHRKAPDSIREVYRRLGRWIKAHAIAVKRESDHRTFWIGTHALAAWRGGCRINVEGLIIDGCDASVAR